MDKLFMFGLVGAGSNLCYVDLFISFFSFSMNICNSVYIYTFSEIQSNGSHMSDLWNILFHVNISCGKCSLILSSFWINFISVYFIEIFIFSTGHYRFWYLVFIVTVLETEKYWMCSRLQSIWPVIISLMSHDY